MRSRFSGRACRGASGKMAASVLNTLLWRVPRLSLFRSAYGVQVPFQTLCTKAPPEKDSLPTGPISPYKDEPWKYLDSEEYQNRYGSRPVWADYRRNHKGGVPPQRTRKTCIRKDKIAGNPCPICRDHKLHVDFRNVKLLEQFVCAHTGIIFHAPYTGVCMKQHKKLTQAIQKARDHGECEMGHQAVLLGSFCEVPPIWSIAADGLSRRKHPEVLVLLHSLSPLLSLPLPLPLFISPYRHPPFFLTGRVDSERDREKGLPLPLVHPPMAAAASAPR
uniref:Small ribosomal subunit protein mS40 n=1 Tax=Oryctolagus cuniculus TaxID=9986 RepID=A0A5F9CI05_RABIT